MLDFGCGSPSPACQTVLDPCKVTEDEFVCQALKLLPPGKLWTRPDCNFSKFFCAIASTYWQQWQRICALKAEASPCTADVLLNEWATIWAGQCDDLPTDQDELRDTLCSLLQYRGVLTCEFITGVMALRGYIVTRCESLKDTTYEVFTPMCGFRTGVTMVGAVYPRTASCADKFTGPCADEYIAKCCEGDDALDLVTEIDCDQTPAVPFKGDCNSSVGYAQSGPSYSPLATPWTLCVLIDPESPAIDQCTLARVGSVALNNNQTGTPNGCPIIQPACAIEALKPAHLTIQYKVDC